MTIAQPITTRSEHYNVYIGSNDCIEDLTSHDIPLQIWILRAVATYVSVARAHAFTIPDLKSPMF